MAVPSQVRVDESVTENTRRCLVPLFSKNDHHCSHCRQVVSQLIARVKHGQAMACAQQLLGQHHASCPSRAACTVLGVSFVRRSHTALLLRYCCMHTVSYEEGNYFVIIISSIFQIVSTRLVCTYCQSLLPRILCGLHTPTHIQSSTVEKYGYSRVPRVSYLSRCQILDSSRSSERIRLLEGSSHLSPVHAIHFGTNRGLHQHSPQRVDFHLYSYTSFSLHRVMLR